MGAKKHRGIWFVQLNFALNTILSMNMVIAFLVAYILDNTVPGSQLERGTYVWSQRSARNEPVIVKEYGLPFGLSNYVTWARWVGLWFKTDDQAYETECRYATVLQFLLLEKSIVWQGSFYFNSRFPTHNSSCTFQHQLKSIQHQLIWWYLGLHKKLRGKWHYRTLGLSHFAINVQSQ